MHYYQFNIADYRKKTGHLSLVEHAIYRALIDTYYLTENPLSTDINAIMRLHSVRTADEKQALENVLSDFFELTDDGYIHDHCHQELDRLYQKSEKARKAAKARWLKTKEKDKDAMRTHSECNAGGILPNNPTPNNPTPNNPLPNKTIDQSAIDHEFDQVWDLYGKKGNKKTSKKKWIKLSNENKQDIYNHLPAYTLSTPDKQYRKNFETYINQECWNDEVINHEQKNRLNGNTGGHRLSAVERVRATNEANRAARANNRDSLGDSDGHIRECAGEPVRGSDAGSLDIVIEGDYTITDQGRAE